MEEATATRSINPLTSPHTSCSTWILKDRNVPQLWNPFPNMKPLLFLNCPSNIWIIIRKRPLKIRGFSYSMHTNKLERCSESPLVWTWGTSAMYRLGLVIKFERFTSARPMRRWLPHQICIQAWNYPQAARKSLSNWTHWWELQYKCQHLSIFLYNLTLILQEIAKWPIRKQLSRNCLHVLFKLMWWSNLARISL